jgi:hypothetical protein
VLVPEQGQIGDQEMPRYGMKHEGVEKTICELAYRPELMSGWTQLYSSWMDPDVLHEQQTTVELVLSEISCAKTSPIKSRPDTECTYSHRAGANGQQSESRRGHRLGWEVSEDQKSVKHQPVDRSIAVLA